VSIGRIAGTPYSFFPPPGRDPFCGSPQSPYGVSNLILGRGEGQAHERWMALIHASDSGASCAKLAAPEPAFIREAFAKRDTASA
jgi:hypothetical protein